ncbi:helix-turn-helix domain-containing protein [Streptomyces sp. NBC_00873]|uniref:helix-turn-helix domain-containing protein n=1 Tax=unclassified Streptomyces TaxID=2593676 RepID=UPI003866873C|nr:helix-turn-helix domain-containing protein [Streptomyces sp. NBC_00873]WTA48893.1 helix-turn-helix domain-containing protein [Streptomyces sp. NBC_00842]
MDTQQITAPSRAPSRVPGSATPSSGVVHINSRHTSRFTVVGNHLTQHRELSLTAIGLAAHIQSLPAGAKIGIRFLADRFPESETRIAAALHELESHGYLQRTRERLPSGQVVTRTVSYNQPSSEAARTTAPKVQPRPELSPRRPAVTTPPTPAPALVQPPAPEPAPAPIPRPDAEAPAAPEPQQVPTPLRPPLPLPHVPDPERHRAAIDLLAGLRRHEPRLLLTGSDIHRLAPAVAAWLERDAHPDAVRRALTTNLPGPLEHPAGLLAHRLTAHLPPPLPVASAPVTAPGPHPLQDCDGCDRPFRAPEPGRCRDCRTGVQEAA